MKAIAISTRLILIKTRLKNHKQLEYSAVFTSNHKSFLLLLGDLAMTFGDGIRRNIAKVYPDERNILKEAFIALNTNQNFRYPGKRNDKPFVGGVSYWFKQDEIHQATHVHAGPAFLPWHREL